MRTPLPRELKAVRVLLFVITGLGLALFHVLIVRGVDQVTLMMGYYSYIGQGFLTLVLGMLLSRGGAWLLYALCGYSAVIVLWALVNTLAGDFANLLQLALPGLILFLVTRPDARLPEANRITTLPFSPTPAAAR